MLLAALREHIDWHLRVISGHAPHLAIEVAVTDLRDGARQSALDVELLQPMRATWPAVDWAFDDNRQAGRNYYTDTCFAIRIVNPDGPRSHLSDGGLTDWTARLLADEKERLLISGLGSERLLDPSATLNHAPR